jgi:Tol biopolymer transport system component
MDWKWMLRGALLAVAAALLPSAGCDSGDVGEGDEIAQVTVRASVTVVGGEPDQECTNPAISVDGWFVAFHSFTNKLTLNDNNGLRDVFLKDRMTGVIENITQVVVPESFPQYTPNSCYDPSVSGDGRYVAFRSLGNYQAFASIGGAPPMNPSLCIYRYDRATKTFERAFKVIGAFDPPPPARDQGPPSISADGRYIAFASTATNLSVDGTNSANPGGTNQVYVYDMDSDSLTLVSHATGSTAPCNASCAMDFDTMTAGMVPQNPQISADGRYVVFTSTATDLDPAGSGSNEKVFLGRADGGNAEVVSVTSSEVPANGDCYFPSVSGDGRYVAFSTNAHNLTDGNSTPYVVRRDRTLGVTETVTDKPAYPHTSPAMPDPPTFPVYISGDGRFVGFLSDYDSLYDGRRLYVRQVFVKDMVGGTIQMASRHLDGRPSDKACERILLSGDGSWVVWQTQGSTLVDGDTNGVTDIYMRGPLR